jgi:hypothetical protein
MGDMGPGGPGGPGGSTTIPYPSPENLVATANANGTISLSWNTKNIPTTASNPLLGYKVSLGNNRGTDGASYNWTINVPSTNTYHSVNGRMANYYTTDVLVANTTNATIHVLINSIKLSPTSNTKSPIPAGLTIQFVLTPQYKNDIPLFTFSGDFYEKVVFPNVTTTGATTMPTTTGTNTYIGCLTALSATPTGGYDSSLLATNPSSASTPVSGSGSGSGSSGPSGSAPSAPTDICGTLLNVGGEFFNGLSLGWAAVQGATFYTLLLKDGVTNAPIYGPTRVNGTGYTRSYITNTSVSYSVTANNGFGASTARTGTLSLLTLIGPDPPTNVTITQHDTRFDVSWTPPVNTGTYDILHYTVSYSIHSGSINGPTVYAGTGVNTDGPVTSYSISNITQTNYTIQAKVKAVSSAGFSTEVSVARNIDANQKGAKHVVATLSNSQVNVTWNSPADITNLIGYTVGNGSISKEIGPDGYTFSTPFYTTTYVDPPNTTPVDKELTNGTSYQFYVTARYNDGNSQTTYAPAVKPCGIPVAPTSLQAPQQGNGFTFLSWSGTDSTSGSTGRYYTVNYGVVGGDITGYTNLRVTSNNVIIHGLMNGSTYTFKVSTTNSIGLTSSYSDSITASPSQMPVEIQKVSFSNLLQSITVHNEVVQNNIALNQVDFSQVCPSLGSAPIDVIACPCRDGSTVNITQELTGKALYIPLTKGSVNVLVGGTSYKFTFLDSPKIITITPGYPGGVAAGTKITLGRNSLRVAGLGSITLIEEPDTAVCFLGNAPVLTPAGYKRIDSLRVGDRVTAADGKSVAIQRVFKQTYEPSVGVNPYVIPAGQYGATKRLLISPDHHVAVNGAMVKARDLGLQQQSMTEPFMYYNLELPTWKNMVVAGVEVESLAPKKVIRTTMADFLEFLKLKGLTLSPEVRRCMRVLQDGSVEFVARK